MRGHLRRLQALGGGADVTRKAAARALTVVHYLQDTGKLDPTRLAALAFGQYRPVSRSNKAVNRRIEIVLYPYRAVIERK